MAKMQRSKGNRGEREVAALLTELLGTKVTRRVRQHDGDSDLVGVLGWVLEVKNHAKVTRGLLLTWWDQTLDQWIAENPYDRPALIYKRAPGWWRVWYLTDTGLRMESDLETWTLYVREKQKDSSHE